MSRAAIAAYTLSRERGVLGTRAGSAVFNAAYMTYKRWFEDSLRPLLQRRPDLAAGGFIFDVGANIGYTALLLEQFCDPPFRVLAFEPEPENIVLLERNVRRAARQDRIEIHDVAVGRSSGAAMLWKNESHHGDHRIVTRELQDEQKRGYLEVRMMSVDDAWTRYTDRGSVAFIKIDVQGFEPEVFAGMSTLLERQRHLSIAFEYDPLLSESLGLDAASSPALLRSEGFQLFRLRRGGELDELKPADLAGRSDYFDIVAIRR